jgi:adenosine deaminase
MRFPTIDLHCHIEGAIHPDLMRRLADRNNLALPADLRIRNGQYLWDDFSGFLAAYDSVASVIRSEQDYRDIVHDYFTRAAATGMIYGEVFSSPDHAETAGLAYPAMVDAMAQGLADAEAETGVVGRVVATCVRHLGPERARDTAQLIADYPHPSVTGFGMGGDERLHTMADFAPAFDIARNAGFALTVHAGEVCGPDSVRDALTALRPQRIGHGVRSIEDDNLVKRLAENAVTLEICPGSNLALGIYPSRESHPFLRFRDAGCQVTLGADDPPFFNTSIESEYSQMATSANLTMAEMLGVTDCAVEAAFCDPDTKARLRQIIDRYRQNNRIEKRSRG